MGKERIFVTGASGLLGSFLTARLLASGYQVNVLMRSAASQKRLLNFLESHQIHDKIEQLKVVFGDLSDYGQLMELFKEIDLVYHCAAMVSFDEKDERQMFETNVEGTRNVVNACLENKVSYLCHVSSIAAIGKASEGDFCTENDIIADIKSVTMYSKTKFLSELEVWRGIEEGLQGVIVNPSVILGSGNDEASSNAIFSMVKKGMKYYTTGVTGYVDVRDVVDIMIQLTERRVHGERYILNADHWSYQELFSTMARNFGVQEPYKELRPKQLRLAYYFDKLLSKLMFRKARLSKSVLKTAFSKEYYSSEKIEKALGYKFIPLAESIAFHSRFYR